ncbi:hypothetical protein QAD02_018687 [Eretmocerus hayati]|uniref:Uncharacterized protein n=1 Tax=Eretmocerus hayati TaxID=131215 RepID=A0ACC2PHJ8_9HYME|nr:hypothetical protein QAD02_018687 [Eretmocerus hayati]
MKTEKKSNEPSCVQPPVVVKEEQQQASATELQTALVPKDESQQQQQLCDTGIIKQESPPVPNVVDEASAAVVDCLKEAADAAAVAGSQEASIAVAANVSADSHNGPPPQSMLGSVKQENPVDPSIGSVNELPPDCGANIGIPGEGIQPLVSNVLSKQMGPSTNIGEAQYMQQQSQIFVFTTQMANKGAEMVLQGHFPSIIAYHMAQPGTKKYLEKYPNKMTHLRQNPHQWMNNMAAIKPKGHQQGPNMGFSGEQPPDIPPLDPNEAAFWNDPPNMRNLNGSNPLGNPEVSLDDANINVPCLVPNSPNTAVNPHPMAGGALVHNPNMMGGTTSPGPGGIPSLQGVKVPDENLTPQQRQHREEQLAALTKMRQMLFPEQQKNTNTGPMDPTQGVMPPGSMCPTGLPPVSAPNQCGPMGVPDWVKLQQSFMDGKNKMGVGSPGVGGIRQCGPGLLPGVGSGGGPGSVGPPNVGPRGQGPPPPYHQTTRSASVPIAMQSPNPASPNNPTSNLSLPSPRASSSALNSPADCNRQFPSGGGVTGQRPPNVCPPHLPGQSPTNQDSPNPAATANRLNHSNPGTPVSHAHLATLSPSGTPQKDPSGLEFPGGQPPNVDGMFCRSLPSLSQQKPQMGPTVPGKDLMPVPSPQQISYLSTFEGQELTIQKQPNTSIKDGSLQKNTQGSNNSEMGNRMLPVSLDGSGGVGGNNQFVQRTDIGSPSMDNTNRGFGGPLPSPHTPHTPHTPGSIAPHTPVDSNKSGNKNLSAQSSPASHNTSLTDMGMGPPRIPASPNTKSETSPTSKDLLQQQQLQQQQQQQQQQQHQQQLHQQQSHQQMPNMPGMMTGVPNNMQPGMQGNLPGQMPVGMMPGMGGPGGGAPFGCIRPPANVNQPNENIPLNPNNMANRMGSMGNMASNSFDPISSLAQMSQQLTNTAPSNVLGNDNSPMHAGNPQGGGPVPGPGPMNDPGNVSGLCAGLGGPGNSYSPTPHIGSPGLPNKMGQPQHSMVPMMGGNGPQGPVNPNVNVNMNQPGNYPSGPGPNMMGPDISQGRLGMPGQHPHQPPGPPHHQQHVHGPSPYNGANVQVKPSAPNTIQYLPARPNIGHAPRGPPSLDFLQRFANPMTGHDAKMNSPSVNLQYFPNGCMPNNVGPNTGPGPGPGPQGLPHGNMGGPGPGGMPPGMGVNQQANMGVQPQGHMHPSMRSVGPPGPQGPNIRQQHNIMRMQHMVGGGVFPSNAMDQDKGFPPDMMSGPQMPNQNANPGMYGNHGGPGMGPKQMNPMGQLGPPPDATQPLPPSMGGAGAGANFKSSPFMGAGPSMSDPNYAQQYHHFQQQLYATGTRGSGPPQGHPNMHVQPNAHAHQQFFMPK